MLVRERVKTGFETDVLPVYEPDDLHLPASLMKAFVGDLYLRRLTCDMHAGDFDQPVMVRPLGTLAAGEVMHQGASIYIHGEPVQAHYRWVTVNKVLERKVFGPEPEQREGEKAVFTRLGETCWFAEEMMRGESLVMDGERGRHMVIHVVCVELRE